MSDWLSMADRLEQRFNGMDIETLEKIIPFYVEYAKEMQENEPQLFGHATVKQLAINAFFDNTNDMTYEDLQEEIFRLMIELIPAKCYGVSA